MAKDAAIIGGSLSGLMYGIVLRDLGYNVTIFERNKESLLAQAGAGLQVGDAVEQLLYEYGCDTTPYWVQGSKADVVDEAGNLITAAIPPVKATSWDQLYYRLRARFDGLETPYYDHKFSALKGTGIYLYDHAVENIEVVDERVKLTCRTHNGDETYLADLVIVADGSRSRTRSLLGESPDRRYLGYLAIRGTVSPESQSEVMRTGIDRHCQIHQSFFISYTIPGAHGSIEPADRARNWVWYRRLAEDSTEYQDLTTNAKTGESNRSSLSRGEMKPEVWEEQKRLARELLEVECSQHLDRTDQPFVQVITSLMTRRAVYHAGKVLLVGDAFATLRPLSGQGTNQGAKGALALRQVLKGEMSLNEWETLCDESAEKAHQFGLAREKQAQLSD